MHKFKIIPIFLMVALTLALLAGCSSSSEPDSQPPAQAPAQSPVQSPAQSPAIQQETSPQDGVAAREPITLNIATAGDANMVDFFQDMIAPAFAEIHPHITLNIVGTGPGDDGSRAIHTMWEAQHRVGSRAWNIDVACVHESVMQQKIEGGLIEQFVSAISNSVYVNTPAAKMSLGFNIEGYAVPLFQSQIVLAYNPETVTNPPRNFDELESWIAANPNRFGYNGVTGGMSGVGFATAWVYTKSGDYEKIALSEYDESVIGSWLDIIRQLRALPVTYTQGNAGTLDMLNRGEIDMGPVWVDMLLLWQSDGRMNPNIKMLLPDPGMPGQPMYMVIGSGTAHSEAARDFVNFLADPAIQALYVVEKSGWNPGIDPTAVFAQASDEAIEMLFSDISAEEFARNGLAMPVGQFRTDLIRIFEETR